MFKAFWQKLARITALSILMLVSACGNYDSSEALYDVKGHLPDLKFTLNAAGGKTMTEQDLAGKTTLVFFGFASCPDICPTTMAALTEVVNRLGDQARDVRILFISVDPHRDTPDMLQAYVDAFNQQAIGLTGTEKQIADVARRVWAG